MAFLWLANIFEGEKQRNNRLPDKQNTFSLWAEEEWNQCQVDFCLEILFSRPRRRDGLLCKHRGYRFSKSLSHSSSSSWLFTAPSSPNGEEFCNFFKNGDNVAQVLKIKNLWGFQCCIIRSFFLMGGSCIKHKDVCLCSVTLRVPPLDSETGYTGWRINLVNGKTKINIFYCN